MLELPGLLQKLQVILEENNEIITQQIASLNAATELLKD